MLCSAHVRSARLMFTDHYDKRFAVVIDLTVFYGHWSMAICAKYTIALTASSYSPYSPVFITLSFHVHPILFQSDSFQSETAAIRNCFNPDWFQILKYKLPSIYCFFVILSDLRIERKNNGLRNVLRAFW